MTQHVEGGQATSFSWNPQNYLVGVTHPDGASESYTYCGEGIRRVRQTQQANFCEFFLCPETRSTGYLAIYYCGFRGQAGNS